MGRFGVPYQGGKSRIAADIVGILPPGERLVDAFAGGCAVTHAALLSKKWGSVLANDIDGRALRLFTRVTSEGMREEDWRWVPRDEFDALKASDGLVACCWSFGNDMRSYLYSRGAEAFKRAGFELVVHRDPSLMRDLGFSEPTTNGCLEDRYLAHRAWWREFASEHADWQSLQSLRSLQSLESLERLQMLGSMKRLQGPETSFSDYRDLEVREGDVVYCDPPYAGTKGYGVAFDNDAFWEWFAGLGVPAYASEYSAPPGVACVWERAVQAKQGATTNGRLVTERLFANEAGARVSVVQGRLFDLNGGD